MNAPRTDAIIRKRGEIRDHALYELSRELEDRLSRVLREIDRSASAGELGDTLRANLRGILEG